MGYMRNHKGGSKNWHYHACCCAIHHWLFEAKQSKGKHPNETGATILSYLWLETQTRYFNLFQSTHSPNSLCLCFWTLLENGWLQIWRRRFLPRNIGFISHDITSKESVLFLFFIPTKVINLIWSDTSFVLLLYTLDSKWGPRIFTQLTALLDSALPTFPTLRARLWTTSPGSHNTPNKKQEAGGPIGISSLLQVSIFFIQTPIINLVFFDITFVHLLYTLDTHWLRRIFTLLTAVF